MLILKQETPCDEWYGLTLKPVSLASFVQLAIIDEPFVGVSGCIMYHGTKQLYWIVFDGHNLIHLKLN
jgi:hypothetical protein